MSDRVLLLIQPSFRDLVSPAMRESSAADALILDRKS
jgi:hypothetical protein